MIKPGFVGMIILAGLIFSCTFSVAEEKGAKPEAPTLKENETSTADVKLNNNNGRIDFAQDPYADMRKRIKEKELAREKADQEEKAYMEGKLTSNDPELMARILAKKLAIEKADQEEGKVQHERIRQVMIRDKKAKDVLTDNCFSCQAVASDNIEVCKEIQDKNRERSCRQSFIILKLFNELNKHKQITSAALNICKESIVVGDRKPDQDPDVICKLMCNAYLTDDYTPVIDYFDGENASLELAFFSGKSEYCNYSSTQKIKQDVCLNNANFTSAIKSNSKESCIKVDEPYLRTICEVYFERDEKKCIDFKNENSLLNKGETIEK